MILSKAEVKWLDASTIDVFTGNGWENWTRFKVKRMKEKVFLEKVKGVSLDKEVFKSICSELEGVEPNL